MLYNTKARKDGTVIETKLVDDESGPMMGLMSKQMAELPVGKKKITRVEYGPYLPTLARLLEEGYFE